MQHINHPAKQFSFHIFCRAIRGLSVHIYITWVGVGKKNALKYAAPYRLPRFAMRS